jgi:hypothetical protein
MAQKCSFANDDDDDDDDDIIQSKVIMSKVYYVHKYLQACTNSGHQVIMALKILMLSCSFFL